MVATSLTRRQMLWALGATVTGGAAGTLLRDLFLKHALVTSNNAASGIVSPSWASQIPWTLLIINAVGVFFATVLLNGALRHRDANDLLRLLIITGFFGGFTSYSGLFVDVAVVWHASAWGGVVVIAGAVASGVIVSMIALRVRRR